LLHDAEFRAHERRHPRFNDAQDWIDAHLPRLLRERGARRTRSEVAAATSAVAPLTSGPAKPPAATTPVKKLRELRSG
jgi:hypothetical protein